MNDISEQRPTTLGEKLIRAKAVEPQRPVFGFFRKASSVLINFTFLMAIAALPLWWLLTSPDMSGAIMLYLLGVLIGLWLLVYALMRMPKLSTRTLFAKLHPLLAYDHQGFMRDLRLDQKTVIFDGSNIYHFGHANGVDAQPLGMVAEQLRTEGYRVVCFFDANIYHTLNEHGAFPREQQHALFLLEDIFGLAKHEIYVVPSGVQADKFVLDSLKHLPISFAVTNDQFRDYAKRYASVMKGDQWRKGLTISGNEIKLFKHKFKQPVRLR